MDLSVAEGRRFTAAARGTRRTRRPQDRPQGYPPDTKNGHVWQREGRGVRCQCGMWLAWQRLPLFGHGAWEAALRGGTP